MLGILVIGIEIALVYDLDAVILQNLVDDGVAATRKGKIVKKAAEPQKKNAKGEKVIVISSDEEENVKEVKGEKELSEKRKPENMVLISHNEEEKVKPVGGQTSVERSSRRKVKTLTSILTARSKVALNALLCSFLLIVKIL